MYECLLNVLLYSDHPYFLYCQNLVMHIFILSHMFTECICASYK